MSLLLEKDKVVQKEAPTFLLFVLYVGNSDMLHVELWIIEYGSLCYTMVAISALCPAQHKKTGQTIILRELLRQISQDHIKIVQGWLSRQELFWEMLAHSLPTKPLAFYCTSEIKDTKG